MITAMDLLRKLFGYGPEVDDFQVVAMIFQEFTVMQGKLALKKVKAVLGE